MKKKNKKTTSGRGSSDTSSKRQQNKGRKHKQKKQSKHDKELKGIILSFLGSQKEKSFTSKELASATGLWKRMNNKKLRSFMDRLTQEGKVEYLDRGRYRYLAKARAEVIVGKVDVTRSGMGFLLQEDEDDIKISAGDLGKALHGDTVKVKVLKRRRQSRKEGKVIAIVERARTEFVGTLEEGLPGKFFLLPDDPKVKTDFRITDPKEGKDGEKVLAKLLKWEGRVPEAEVIRVLGAAGEHQTEMHAILLQYGFQPDFPPHVEAEAEKIPETIPPAEAKKRRDFRSEITFTIDPADAKDFDDALSFKRLKNDRMEVGIHIADVSYYVKPGGLIDQEAIKRATSVYLVDRTIPMLPEKLSNLLCSLRPKEDKLTFSAVFELDGTGRIHKEWFGRGIIHSNHRFHYEEAQAVIDGQQPGPFQAELRQLNDLAHILRRQRMGTGSIEFETNEVRFELDENDKPIRVIKKERMDTHKMIEDFMLLANRRVAAYVHGIFKDPPLPFVYRIHDTPNPEKLSSLGEFAGHFGHRINFEKVEDTSAQLNELLSKVQGKPEQNVIESLAIRSMAKAVYSTHNIGHFGLGFKFYTHFTSPIRRYPDLMVHRLLDHYLNKQYKVNQGSLEEDCDHCSRMERTAAEAERASIKYKQVEFLEDKIGQSFDGIISGVIESGLFVELEDSLCEGFVPVHSLDQDYFIYDSDRHELRGRDSNEQLRLGDPIRVEVAETNLQRRQIEFIFLEKRGVKKKKKK